MVQPEDQLSPLERLLKDQKDKQAHKRALAETEANEGRSTAPSQVDRPTKSSKKSGAKKTESTKKPAAGKDQMTSFATLVFMPEGKEAFLQDQRGAAAPPGGHCIQLAGFKFAYSAVSREELQVARRWTHEETLRYFASKVPDAFSAIDAATQRWKDDNPFHDADEVPAPIVLLTQQGRMLVPVEVDDILGVHITTCVTSGQKWEQRKLYLTSGLDVSAFCPPKMKFHLPCEAWDGEEKAPIKEKRKRTSSPPTSPPSSPRVTRAAAAAAVKKQKLQSPPLIIDMTSPPAAGPSRIPSGPSRPRLTIQAPASTSTVTGFMSPPSSPQ